MRPATGGRSAEQRLDERRLARAVRADHGHALAALDHEPGIVEQRLVARAQREVLGLDHDAPAALDLGEAERERAVAARRLDALGMRWIAFAFDCAWRERVPARNLSTKRCSRSISACWRSNASAWFASAIAFSRR